VPRFVSAVSNFELAIVTLLLPASPSAWMPSRSHSPTLFFCQAEGDSHPLPSLHQAPLEGSRWQEDGDRVAELTTALRLPADGEGGDSGCLEVSGSREGTAEGTGTGPGESTSQEDDNKVADLAIALLQQESRLSAEGFHKLWKKAPWCIAPAHVRHGTGPWPRPVGHRAAAGLQVLQPTSGRLGVNPLQPATIHSRYGPRMPRIPQRKRFQWSRWILTRPDHHHHIIGRGGITAINQADSSGSPSDGCWLDRS